MSPGPEIVLLLAAAAGGLVAVAGREAVLATPVLARWMARTLEPVRRAGREGYAPSEAERRRLAVLVAAALLVTGLVIAGPVPAPLLALAGPSGAAWTVRARRARYRRAVDEGLAGIALAVADALSGGRSLRAALASADVSLVGPPAVEMSRVRADLELGRPTAVALGGLRERMRSVRVDSFCTAATSQQLAGGDLAGLLRRFAASAAERDRSAAEARSATAQARFTGMLVAAMPAGSAVFAELIEPGFIGGLLAEPAPAALLALAAMLQVAGFVAIGRLSRVDVHG
jgi:tight adherence protein B